MQCVSGLAVSENYMCTASEGRSKRKLASVLRRPSSLSIGKINKPNHDTRIFFNAMFQEDALYEHQFKVLSFETKKPPHIVCFCLPW